MKRAEVELMYMEEHNIRALTLTDDDYPQRLTECQDAPIILYYKGNADLNQAKIVSIVGTRQCTPYGQDL
ncbi:DNA-processing protein DprA, partial [Puniceibacterium confluentis]|uniref:DNA-processing protein DprA n=1 Tax=Puniceibacterium confluentis TaxID=1958944 RepID=UPI001C9798A0